MTHKTYKLAGIITSKQVVFQVSRGDLSEYWSMSVDINNVSFPKRNYEHENLYKDVIEVYRIREDLPSLNDTSKDFIVQKNQVDLEEIVQKVLFKITGKKIDVDLKRDAIAIENIREFTEKENSLLISNPEIAEEWNCEKNGRLKPENFAGKSGKQVWWKCKRGHEWKTTIASREGGNGCPYCVNQKVLQGYNDLATLNPNLLKEWNYEKNGSLKPENVTAKSGLKAWWRCEKGHEWKMPIISRNNGGGCPYCSSQKLLPGYNDLLTLNPSLSLEWNYEKNGKLKPENVFSQGGQKVWWKCKKGHEWQAKINNRANGRGCPYCANKKVLQGYNDLATVNPDLSQEWNYELNGDLMPTEVSSNSNKKVWWKCKEGHVWQAIISSRNRGCGCSSCYRLLRKK